MRITFAAAALTLMVGVLAGAEAAQRGKDVARAFDCRMGKATFGTRRPARPGTDWKQLGPDRAGRRRPRSARRATAPKLDHARRIVEGRDNAFPRRLSAQKWRSLQ